MNRKITITLDGPAKIDGQDYKANETVETTLGTALQLVEMGVLAALPDIEGPPVMHGEDLALHEKAKAMAETMVAQAVAEAMTKTAAELENERRRADDLALQLAAVTAERDTLAAQVAAGTGQPADTEAASLSGGQVTPPAQKKSGK